MTFSRSVLRRLHFFGSFVLLLALLPWQTPAYAQNGPSQLLADIRPGEETQGLFIAPTPGVLVSGSIIDGTPDRVFFVGFDPVWFDQLYVTNGNPATTQRVSSLRSATIFNDIRDLTRVGAWLYFTAQNESNGRSLFVLDLEASEPEIQAIGLVEGALDSDPRDLLAQGTSRLIFTTLRSNGQRTIAIIEPNSDPLVARFLELSPGLVPSQLTLSIISNELLFVAGGKLMRLDLADPAAMANEVSGDYLNPQELTRQGFNVFFRAERTPSGNQELFRYTNAGTIEWVEVRSNGNPTVRNLVATNSQLFFIAVSDTNNTRLFRRTGGGVVEEVLQGSESLNGPERIVRIGARVALWANNNLQQEIVISDGTAANTVFVDPVEIRDRDEPLVTVGDQILYPAQILLPEGGFEDRFRVIDAAAANPTSLPFPIDADDRGSTFSVGITPVRGNSRALIGFGGSEAYLTNGVTLSDLTPSGLTRPRSSFVGRFSESNGERVLFQAFNPTIGQEFWSTDGTPAGTQSHDIADGEFSISSGFQGAFVGERYVQPLYNGADQLNQVWAIDFTTFPATTEQLRLSVAGNVNVYTDLFVAGGKAFFIAATPETGSELAVTDGTLAGTRFLELAAGPTSGVQISRLMGATPSGNVFFSTQTFPNGLGRSDGTPSGTQSIEEASGRSYTVSTDRSVVFGEQVLFEGSFSGIGNELGMYDPAENKVYAVELNPGGNSNPRSFTLANDLAFFVATTTANGSELWATDGTVAGTQILELALGAATADPRNLRPTSQGVFFNATSAQTGAEIGFSDGTPSNTRLLNLSGNNNSSNPVILGIVGDRAVIEADLPNGGRRLFVSDGTPSGTNPISLSGAVNGYAPQLINIFGEQALFSVYTPSLGRVAAVLAGNTLTPLIPDDGPTPRLPFDGISLRDGAGVIFQAYTETTGYELWWSDGTPEFTRMVEDLNPGIANIFSDFTNGRFAEIGSAAEATLIYVGDDGIHGSEPRALPLRELNFFAPTLSGSTELSVEAGAIVEGQALGTDGDGNSLTYRVSQAPSQGTLTLDETSGAYSYQANGNASGSDSFTIMASDGEREAPALTVTVTITQPGETPTPEPSETPTPEPSETPTPEPSGDRLFLPLIIQ